MDLAVLLDFICLGIGRLDLLAAVELSRILASPEVESLTSAGWHQSWCREGPWSSKGKLCYWSFSACQLWVGPRRSGPHILCPSDSPPAFLGGWTESVITNVL